MQLPKLTFSLASLVLIFAIGIFAMPTMAHQSDTHTPSATGGAGHPVVTISEASYPSGFEKSRANYRVSIVATVGGSSDSDRFDAVDELIASELTVRPFTGDGAPLTAVDPTLARTTGKHEWVATIDLSGAATARSFEVTVAADAVNGNRRNALGGNETKSMSFTNLSAVLDYSAKLTTEQKKVGETPIPGRYTVTLQFLKDGEALVDADDDVDPEPAISDLRIMPMGSATAVDASGAAVSDTSATMSGAAATGIYTQDYQLTFGVTSATVSLISGYATNAPSVTLDPNPPPDTKQNPPTVTLRIVEHNANDRWFNLDAMTAPVADTEGGTGKAITGAAIKDALKIMSGSTPPAEVPLRIRDDNPAKYEDIRENRYRAFLSYGVFDDLPLTVSIDPNDLVDNDDAADVDPVTKMVGGPETPPSSDIAFSPSQFANQTFVAGTPITPVFLPMATGGTPPYTYTLAPLPTGLVFTAATQELSGTPTVAGTTTPTYTVTDAADMTATLTFTIVVLSADTPSVIPDTSLAAAIRRSLNLAANTPLTAAVMADLTDLNAYNSGVARLDGLQQATNLTTLDLGMNRITNISVLSGMSQLTHLYLDDNQITNVSALSGLRNLRLLRLARNPIQDTSPLATLIANNPGLDLDIPPISPDDGTVTFTDSNLETAVRTALRMTANETITEDAMLNLFFLEAYDRRIVSIQGLEHATNMIALDLGKNAIVDISPLSGLTQLQILFLDDNEIVDVSPLAGLTQLDLLFLTGNPISSLAPISHLIGGIQIFRSKAAE